MNIIDNKKVVYQAIFVNPEDVTKLIQLQKDKLPREVKNMHCTFKFQPSEEDIKKFSKLLGNELELKVVGYCSDGKNSGYEIELSPEQESVYSNAHTVDTGKAVPIVEKTIPHITVSMSDGAKAVDTGMLPFSRKNFDPFFIHGKAGYFTSDIERKTEIIYEPILLENETSNIPKSHTK